MVCKSMSHDQSNGLPLLFAISGCDFTESFYDVGQISWLNQFLKDDVIPKIFTELLKNPMLLQNKFDDVTKFVLSVYKVKNPNLGCSTARCDTFKYKTITTLRQLPPSKPALFQHMRRALYVAAYVWGRAHIPDPPYVDPFSWGWINTNGVCVPLWTNFIYVLSDKAKDPFLQLRSSCSCGRGKQNTSQRSLCKNCSCKRRGKSCWKKCGCFGEC